MAPQIFQISINLNEIHNKCHDRKTSSGTKERGRKGVNLMMRHFLRRNTNLIYFTETFLAFILILFIEKMLIIEQEKNIKWIEVYICARERENTHIYAKHRQKSYQVFDFSGCFSRSLGSFLNFVKTPLKANKILLA